MKKYKKILKKMLFFIPDSLLFGFTRQFARLNIRLKRQSVLIDQFHEIVVRVVKMWQNIANLSVEFLEFPIAIGEKRDHTSQRGAQRGDKSTDATATWY